ncbi:shikimate kinase [bacterium]|nr:shikimate kinase [bacterium]
MKSGDGHVYLMGFMGSGKTRVGRILADFLRRPFIDTDAHIEEETGLSINALFEKKGEAGFREIERNVIRCLADTRRCVISLGGGSVIHPENWEAIVRSGTTIALSYPPEILAGRLERKKDRPLLNQAGDHQRMEIIRTLMTEREPYYRRADLVLHLNREIDPEAVADMIRRYVEALP